MARHIPLASRTAVVVHGVAVFTLERNSPGLFRPYSSATPHGFVSKDRQFGEVVPAVDSDSTDVVHGIEVKCVGHCHRRGALQPAWSPAGPPLPGLIPGQVVGVHCCDWTCSWTVILINSGFASLLRDLSEPIEL